MTDLLIRDVPDDVVVAIDEHARRLGISRTEYLRRRLARDAVESGGEVTVEDLRVFADTFGDLGDAEVMQHAWE